MSSHSVIYIVLMVTLLVSCDRTTTPNVVHAAYPDSTLTLPSAKATALATQIEQETNYSVMDGLEVRLWASDSLMADPIAISIDDEGGIYYTQANRLANSEFDIRGHRDWMTESISWQSVEDRRAFLRRTLSDDSEQALEHMPDLNKDGTHNWKDLLVEKEDIWRLSDTDDDGVADHARLYVRDFHEEITDLALGVEVFDGDVYMTAAPDLWKMKDIDGDGIADTKESLAHGFGVHIGFGAHGLSGVTMGPDGRIYWGIGDIGANVIDRTGKQWKYPNRGVIARCETDGSNFEIFSHGHRNTHEFTFDKYGNLISEDNDGDHQGERERLVYIIHGSDSGWRINWQFGKYTDPDNNGYKVWMDEKLSIPHWEGQAAYILPPIQNYVNGPTGLVYNPGTALGPEWEDHFFIAEFRGTPAASPIHAFTLKADGAGFALDDTKEIVSGLLPTGLDFGPDGALYFGDWINGWGSKNLGRMWKLDVSEGNNSSIRRQTKALIQSDFSIKSLEELSQLLAHSDQRIRRKAQFELVKREEDGLNTLSAVASDSDQHQMARIHAIWGIGHFARRDKSITNYLNGLLQDQDEEIIVQTIKMIADAKDDQSADQIVRHVLHMNSRLSMHATEALGRLKYEPAHDVIVEMIRRNAGKDMWLRHAGMIALARIGQRDQIIQLKEDASVHVRLAAVVALRRMEDPGIAQFLNDKDELVVTEAARGINDDWSIEGALPALADILNKTPFQSEPLIRRSISANLRVGDKDNLNNLIQYALRTDMPVSMRQEAIATISTWTKPSLHDRVDGRYRGIVERSREPVVAAITPHLNELFESDSPTILAALSHMVAKLKINSAADQLFEYVRSHPDASIRSAALTAISSLEFNQKSKALEIGLGDASDEVRSNALALVPASDIPLDEVVQLFTPILANGSIQEKQSIYQVLGAKNDPVIQETLTTALQNLISGKVEQEVQLDIIDAIEAYGDSKLIDELNNHFTEEQISATALYGGNPRMGEQIFYNNESAQCVRCHAVFEYGGNAGPVLAGVSNRLSKEKLLESLIHPSAELAQGYAVVALSMKDGSTQAGTVISENDSIIQIRDGEGTIIDVQKSEIENRTNVPSSMPNASLVLSKKEIRDVVAWLSTLEKEVH